MELAWLRRNANLAALQQVRIEVGCSAPSRVAAILYSSIVEDEVFGDGLAPERPKGEGLRQGVPRKMISDAIVSWKRKDRGQDVFSG